MSVFPYESNINQQIEEIHSKRLPPGNTSNIHETIKNCAIFNRIKRIERKMNAKLWEKQKKTQICSNDILAIYENEHDI